MRPAGRMEGRAASCLRILNLTESHRRAESPPSPPSPAVSGQVALCGAGGKGEEERVEMGVEQ